MLISSLMLHALTNRFSAQTPPEVAIARKMTVQGGATSPGSTPELVLLRGASEPAAATTAALEQHIAAIRPELLPAWRKHSSKCFAIALPDLRLRGAVADTFGALDRAFLAPAAAAAAAAASDGSFAAEDLVEVLVLSLRLSYLHTLQPKELQQQVPASELQLLSAVRELGFPAQFSGAAVSQFLELLHDHLKLDVPLSTALQAAFALAQVCTATV
jgi:hypothetical protein